jgi:hypothetical protein
VGEASDAELQDAVFGSAPPGADSNADSGLQVDYGFLSQQGIDMGEPMTTVAGTASAEDDPLGVSSAGIDIGPRIGVGDYALSLGGVGWGLVKSTVTGIWNTGAAIFRPSERLQNLDNLEYADIEGYANYPTEPGLSWETIGDSLSAQIAQSNENARIAKANEDYFSLGMAYSENPLMQMSGLGDLAVFGTLGKFGKLAPNRGIGDVNDPNFIGPKFTSSTSIVDDALAGLRARNPNGPTVVIPGTKNVLAGDPLPPRIYNSDGSLVPLGFNSVDEFNNFGASLNQGLRNAGFDDVAPIFQGSSVTGFKGFDKVKNGIVTRSAGTIFDTGGVSDFDIALSSPQMLSRAKEIGLPVIGKGTRTFELNNRALKKLGLYDMRQSLQSQVNRPVNFVIFDSVSTATSKANTSSVFVRR